MIIDPKVIDALAIEFLRKRGTNYITGTLVPGDTATALGTAENKFAAVYVQNLFADNISWAGSTTDTVDGFHASSVPQANTLLALDGSAQFPAAALGPVLFRTGGIMTGNLDTAPGVLVDGVDINIFKQEFDAFKAAGGNQGDHGHTGVGDGGVLTQFASRDGYGNFPAHSAERLNRFVLPGNGLTGGGKLDQNVRLDVVPGNGLSIASSGAVQMNTPGTISAISANTAAGSHTHAVTASSDPAGVSLLQSNSDGGLRLRRIGVGSAAIPGEGGLHASGDLHGQRVLSDSDTFVGGDLQVGDDVLNTVNTRQAVYINPETANPTVQGALTVRPGVKTQRGVVIQGQPDQEPTAPLLAVVDADDQDVLVVRASGVLESGTPAFVSGVAGWRVTGEGDAEFRNITARGELHTSIFVANEMHASGGTMAIMPTGVVDAPVLPTDNIVDTTFNLVISGDPNVPGVCAFQENDVLRLKLMTARKE